MTRLADDLLAQLEDHIAQGNIRATAHPRFDLTLYNYTPQVQYARAWDEVTRMCRGLVLDADHNVVARPFPKFFNWGEWDPDKQADYITQPFTITEKLDGSLGILYHYDGSWHIATRGSFASEQAEHAAKLLTRHDLSQIPTEGVTPLVEIIYPGNRVVVDYGGREELVLLSALSTPTGQRLASPWWDGPRVRTLDIDIETALLATGDGLSEEGYVVTFRDGEMAKVKLAEYVRLHRILTGTNAVRVWEAMQDPDTLAVLVEAVPDEFYDWVRGVMVELGAAYYDIEEAAKALYRKHNHLAFEGSRKDFALEAVQTAYPDILFAMLDGKDYAPRIWRRIKPEATKPFREEV